MKNVFSQGVTLANDYLERPDVLEWEKITLTTKKPTFSEPWTLYSV